MPIRPAAALLVPRRALLTRSASSRSPTSRAAALTAYVLGTANLHHGVRTLSRKDQETPAAIGISGLWDLYLIASVGVGMGPLASKRRFNIYFPYGLRSPSAIGPPLMSRPEDDGTRCGQNGAKLTPSCRRCIPLQWKDATVPV